MKRGLVKKVKVQMDGTLFKGIIDSIPDELIVVYPGDYSIITANKKFLEKESLSLKNIGGKKCYNVTHKRTTPCALPDEPCPMSETIKTRKLSRAEHVHHDDKKKETRYLEVITSPILDSSGNIKAVVHLVRDITGQRKAEEENKRNIEELKALVLRDSHTGLYNYKYLMERLSVEIELLKRHPASLAILLIDVDYFRSINDTYGYQMGDRILSEFVNFIKRFSRKSDVLTRYGGEEFILIMPQTNKMNALYTANRIIEKVHNHVFKIDKVQLKIKVSIGISDFSLENNLSTTRGILDAADKALQRAKEAGGNRAVVFSSLYRKSRTKTQPINYKKEVEFLKRKIAKLDQRADQAVLESMYAFSKSLEARDYYTAEHAERMVSISLAIGRRMGLNEDVLLDLEKAAILHDIGKIGISDAILRKKGKLSSEEYKIIKTHPQIGAEIIRAVHFLKDVVPIVLHHHERFDGRGYPSGLKDGEIPLSARIIAITDAYQALTSDRPYRKAYSKKEALKILKQEAGTHFDKRIVNILVGMERSKK